MSDGTIATEPILAKPNHKPFLEGNRIARALAMLEPRAAKLAASRIDRHAFAIRAADLLLTLNNIHPFREGNGRTQRAFIADIARAACHRLDFRVITKERMARASIAGHEDGDRTPMLRVLFDAIDSERITSLAKAIAFLQRQEFEWNERYISTVHNTKPVEVTMAEIAGADFMARTGEDILIGRTEDLPLPRPKLGQVTFVSRPRVANERERPVDAYRRGPKWRQHLCHGVEKMRPDARRQLEHIVLSKVGPEAWRGIPSETGSKGATVSSPTPQTAKSPGQSSGRRKSGGRDPFE